MSAKASPNIYDINHSRWVDFKNSLVWWGVGSVGALMLVLGWPYKIIRYPGAILLTYGGTMIYFLYSGQIIQVTEDFAAVYNDAPLIAELARKGAACDGNPQDRTNYLCLPHKTDFANPVNYDAKNNEDKRLYDSNCTQILLQNPSVGLGLDTDWIRKYDEMNCGKLVIRRQEFLAPSVPKGRSSYLAGGGL